MIHGRVRINIATHETAVVVVVVVIDWFDGFEIL